MSPLARVCNRHRIAYPFNGACPYCAQKEAERRSRNNRDLGRDSRHWRRLSQRARSLVSGQCPRCLRYERPNDPSTKLTVHLRRGGDHRTATIEETEVLCRRCHGEGA